MTRSAVDPEKQYAHLKNKVQWALCDKCGWYWPEKFLNERDGRKVCPNHSTYLVTTRMLTERYDRAAARLAKQKEPVPMWPTPPEMRAVPGIELIAPSPVTLIRGGAGVMVVFTGVNLSSVDTLTCTSGEVAFSGQVYSAIDPDTHKNTLTVTLTVANALAPRGDFDLLYNGDTFKDVVEVR